MSDLKFECPSCGQQMECNKACGGDIIHCPNCCAELRIPFESAFPGELSIPRAELILHADGNPPASSAAAKAEGKTTAHHEDKSDRFICPVCHSELRSPVGASQGGQPPVAQLIRREPPTPATPQPTAPAAPHPHPDLAHLSIEERERQIAAAREAHPVQSYPAMKPRLDYILSGERPPAAGEHHEEKKEEAPPPTPPIKSLSE